MGKMIEQHEHIECTLNNKPVIIFLPRAPLTDSFLNTLCFSVSSRVITPDYIKVKGLLNDSLKNSTMADLILHDVMIHD